MRDTGPGIPPIIREKLFEVFQTAARTGGSGLGLAIAAELVRAHGGKIEVVDSSAQGSAFEITLPDHKSQHAD